MMRPVFIIAAIFIALAVLSILARIAILIFWVSKAGKKAPTIEHHMNPIYRGTGKCIDCESQFQEEKWRGGSNKCYDCESDMVARTGSGYGAMKSKCFDC